MLILLAVLAAFFVSLILFVQQPSFGKTPAGAELDRIRRSPHYRQGKFQNINPTPDLTEGVSYYTVMKEFFFEKSDRIKPRNRLPSKKPDLLRLNYAGGNLVWFGHSSYFLYVDGKTFLIDPVFSGGASPVKFTTPSYPGSDIFTVEDLPPIDCMLISHDHWDHLDYETVVKLRPKVKRVITGLGVGSHFRHWGYDPAVILELDWNERVELGGGFVIHTTTARHFSGRGFKRMQSIWLSFVLQTPSMKLFIGGDSGYDQHFKEIGNLHGPFDLAILECGQYNKNWKYIHMMPEEVIQAGEDLKAKRLMPVHWAKFTLGQHAWDEPVNRLVAENEKKKIPLLTPLIGEKVDLSHPVPTTTWWNAVGVLVIGLALFGCQKQPAAGTGPEAALSTFELEPGFKIELLASEPLVGDPVDMEIDEYGRLYVVEMFGYPLDKSGTGKINLLSDTNGDGRMDKSTVFADQLVLPNSVMRWKNGILVTDAPNVLYFEDADGDGKAEIRDTLLTGFALSNPQHNLNSPLLGMDNWIYLGHEGAVGTDRYVAEFGDPGRDIYYPGLPMSPRLGVNAGGRAVRFRPDRHGLEMLSSYTQFGHTFDAWGHHLLVSNANHAFHEVIAQRYLTRNPDLLVSDASESISDHGDDAEVFPITRNPQNQLLTDIGVITSACGITAYLGGSFPSQYDSITFVAEPVSNLVHADKISGHGATFIAQRLRAHQEFLASTDPKFRPVNMYVGPDGALYVVDFYRQIIEHPEWMGEDVIQSGQLYNDSDKGRIYRISTTSAKPAEWTKGITLGKATDDELANLLASSNSWYRQNAQRLLVDRNRIDCVPALLRMLSNKNSSYGRLHALWTLEGIGALKEAQIIAALKDPVPGIRENAIKLAEPLLKSPGIMNALLNLQDDQEPKVRFQLLCTLGSNDSPEIIEVRHKILFQDINDRWVQLAALSSSSPPTSLIAMVLRNYRENNSAYSSLVERLSTMLGVSGKQTTIRPLLTKATDLTAKNQSGLQAAILDGLADGLGNEATKSPLSKTDQQRLIETFFQHPSGNVRKAAYHVLKSTGIEQAIAAKSIEKAVLVVSDHRQPEEKRAESVDFISLGHPSDHKSMLMGLVIPSEDLSVQLAALRTLSQIPDTTVFAALLKQWPALTHDLRDATQASFLRRDDRIAMFLDAIQAGQVQPADVSWPRKVGLMAQSNEKLRDKSRKLFTKNNEKEVNKEYQTALQSSGDAIKGEAIYQQQCALCHQIRGKDGIALGPDLGTVHNWSPDAIMANILDPNLSISSGYDLWTVDLQNGEVVQGIIESETPGAIKLKNQGSPPRTIKRQEIKSLKASNLSAMPSGLDKQISVEQMADLLAYLKKNK